MRQVITALIAMTCLWLFAGGSAEAQVPKSFTVQITNRTDTDVLVKAYTIVNGVQRNGSIVQVPKNSHAFEMSVPVGVRFYTVYDTKYQILLRDHQVPIQNPNVAIQIMAVPGQPNRVIIR